MTTLLIVVFAHEILVKGKYPKPIKERRDAARLEMPERTDGWHPFQKAGLASLARRWHQLPLARCRGRVSLCSRLAPPLYGSWIDDRTISKGGKHDIQCLIESNGCSPRT